MLAADAYVVDVMHVLQVRWKKISKVAAMVSGHLLCALPAKRFFGATVSSGTKAIGAWLFADDVVCLARYLGRR